MIIIHSLRVAACLKVGGPLIDRKLRSNILKQAPSYLSYSLVLLQSMASSRSSPPADTFQLYDLRVEVICPPGERILCGAKEGDHFILEGEMLHLPPDQGFSIYSLGKPV